MGEKNKFVANKVDVVVTTYIAGQSVPIPRYSQTRAKNDLLTIYSSIRSLVTDRNRFIFQAVHAKKTLKIILMSYLYLHLAW